MSRLQTSLILFTRSLQIIRTNKRLLLFPIITICMVGVIALCFIAPVALIAGFDVIERMAQSLISDRPAAPVVLLGVLYLGAMAASTFVNVAFFNEILKALNGESVSVQAGLRFASSRLKPILQWSLFAGLVGLLIRLVERRVGVLGRWIVGAIGLTWSAGSVFVIPVLIRDEGRARPMQLLRSSASLLKRTWGESLVGYAGMALLGGVVGVVGMLFAVLMGPYWGAMVGAPSWIIPLVSVVGFSCVFSFYYLLHVASQVYRGALFIYATEGVVPGPFSSEDMNGGWQIRHGRRPL